jgi:hypothetical protein
MITVWLSCWVALAMVANAEADPMQEVVPTLHWWIHDAVAAREACGRDEWTAALAGLVTVHMPTLEPEQNRRRVQSGAGGLCKFGGDPTKCKFVQGAGGGGLPLYAPPPPRSSPVAVPVASPTAPMSSPTAPMALPSKGGVRVRRRVESAKTRAVDCSTVQHAAYNAVQQEQLSLMKPSCRGYIARHAKEWVCQVE